MEAMKVCDFRRQQFDEFWRSFQKLAAAGQGPAGQAAKLLLLHEQQEDQQWQAADR